MLPICLDVRGRRAVVFGAGTLGCRRAAQLVAEGALVRVIARDVLGHLPAGVDEVLRRPYRRGDLKGAAVAVAAVGDATVNDAICDEARATSTLLNVVDDPVRSSFYFPAVHRAGDVTVAVSTAGAAPALASFLRDRVAATLPADLAQVAARLKDERRLLHERGISTQSVDWTSRIARLL
jgi:siroheme synthase-like protein